MEDWVIQTVACSPVLAREIVRVLQCIPDQLLRIVIEYVSKQASQPQICLSVQTTTNLPFRAANLISLYAPANDWRNMADNAILTKGIEIMSEAIHLDNQGSLNVPEAEHRVHWNNVLAMYQKGIQYLITGAKYLRNEYSKNVVRSKIKQFFARAETIKNMIDDLPIVTPTHTTQALHAHSSHQDQPEDRHIPVFLPAKEVKWDKIFGLESVKQVIIEQIVLPLKFSHLFRGRAPGSVLLVGYPGTGKTMLAQGIQTMLKEREVEAQFYAVCGAELYSRYGASEAVIRNLFQMIQAPCILFIDDLDRMIGPSEGRLHRQTEFLLQMQGRPPGVVVLAATNTPWDIPAAYLRRFEKRILFSLPDLASRALIFRELLNDIPHSLTNEDFLALAKQSANRTGADMVVAVREANMSMLRHILKASHFRRVNRNGTLHTLQDEPGNHEQNQASQPVQVTQPLVQLVTSSNAPPTPMFWWAACESGDSDSQLMSLENIPSSQVYIPPLSFHHFGIEPQTLHNDHMRLESWAQEHT